MFPLRLAWVSLVKHLVEIRKETRYASVLENSADHSAPTLEAGYADNGIRDRSSGGQPGLNHGKDRFQKLPAVILDPRKKWIGRNCPVMRSEEHTSELQSLRH